MFAMVLAVTIMVTVMNPEGLWDAFRSYTFGEQCELTFPLNATPLGELDGKILYRYDYRTLDNRMFVPPSPHCPRNTLFLTSPEDYARHNGQERQEERDRQELRDRVKGLIHKK